MKRIFGLMLILCSICVPVAGQETTPKKTSVEDAKKNEMAAIDFEKLRWTLEHADELDGWEDESDGSRVTVCVGAVRGSVGEFLVRAESLILWEKPRAKDAPKEARPKVEFYAEGNVLISRGDEMVMGDAIYFDVANDQGVIINGNLKVLEEENGIFLYLRGDYIRGNHLSDAKKRKLKGRGLQITTSSFRSPFWSFHMKEADIDSSRSANKQVLAKGAILRLGSVPVMYFPQLNQGIKKKGPLKGLNVGQSRQMGAFVQSEWGRVIQEGVELTLEADYYTERGFAGGLDLDYKQEDYFGYIDTYFVPNDQGEDFEGTPLLESNRGRIHALHRQQLPWEIRLDAEVSYVNDRNFLDEYFEKEAREDKPQETYFYLRKLYENKGASLLVKDRINDFQTEVDSLPRAKFNMYGQPLWETGAYWDSENEIGNLRIRYDEDLTGVPQADNRAWRGHSRNEVRRPINVFNSVWLTPMVGVDMTAYDDSPSGGSIDRTAGLLGLRLAGTWWKVFDIKNKFWNLNGMRHIFSPDLQISKVYGSNEDPNRLQPFENQVDSLLPSRNHRPVDVLRVDEIDNLAEGEFVKLSFRNRFQTKRKLGKDETLTNVTFLDVDMSLSYQQDRDNNPHGVHEFSAAEYDLTFIPRQGITVTSDMEFNMRRGKVDIWNNQFSYRASKKTRFTIGHRYAQDVISASKVTVAYNWSKRWSTEAYYEYEWESRGTTNSGIIFKRNFQDFILQIGIDVDNGDDNPSITFALVTPFEKKSREDFFSRYALWQK